jgi:hypothetical protein
VVAPPGRPPEFHPSGLTRAHAREARCHGSPRTIKVPRRSDGLRSREAIMRTILLLLAGALCGCATKPGSAPQSLDARALCQQQAEASASSPEQKSDAYFEQCMIASSKRPKQP